MQPAAVPDDWTSRLASANAAALPEFGGLLGRDSVLVFDIGCFPWHGFVELSVLTKAEFDADPTLLEPRLDSLTREVRFRIRVIHPDSGREFWPLGAWQRPNTWHVANSIKK